MQRTRIVSLVSRQRALFGVTADKGFCFNGKLCQPLARKAEDTMRTCTRIPTNSESRRTERQEPGRGVRGGEQATERGVGRASLGRVHQVADCGVSLSVTSHTQSA